MKKVYVSYPLYVALGALFLIGCASTNPRSAASPVDYTRPEIQEIFSSSWTGRLEWENRGGMDRYEAEIEFEHNPSENNVIARIDLTLLEAHRMSVQNGQEGKKAQWFLSGDLLETGGELHLTEQERVDPHDFLTAWVAGATLAFGPEWESFTGEFIMSDGTPIDGEVFVGTIAE